ncbi:hypothetical protein [Phenylobacterium sp.]|uniref:head-tail joining protein n=1 Tax=Phenylobacterium sp. TaxID=1871053 RepID=UPI0035AFC122
MAIDWDAKVLAPVMRVFGENGATGDVVYTHVTGEQVTLTDAVFDEAYLAVMQDTEGAPPVNTTMPVLGVRRAALARDPALGDKALIERKGEIYMVRDTQPDGHGHILLMLGFVGPA